MTDITIPDAAVEAVAAELASWDATINPETSIYHDDARSLIELAAPYIAAQALRDAAAAFYSPDGPRGEVGPAVWLRARANQIEADHG